MGGLFCRDETMARPDADDAGYLYAAESGRVVVSFGLAARTSLGGRGSSKFAATPRLSRRGLCRGGAPPF